MPSSISRAKAINILELGCIPGIPQSGSAVDQAAAEARGVQNSTILTTFLARGPAMLYVPTGDWLLGPSGVRNSGIVFGVDAETNFHADMGIVGDGPASRLIAVQDIGATSNFNTILAYYVRGIVIQDLTVHGQNYYRWLCGRTDEATHNSGNEGYGAVRLQKSENCLISRCELSLNNKSGVYGTDSEYVTVQDSYFWGNQTKASLTTYQETLDDINLASTIAPGLSVQQALITGNRCYSNSSNHIHLNRTGQDVQILGNQCVTSSINFDARAPYPEPVTVADDVQVKHNITCHYGVTKATQNAPSGVLLCNDNICRGGRWGQIYLNNNITNEPNLGGGTKGTVANNHVSFGGMDRNDSTALKHGGIIVEAFKSLVVEGNVVEDIESPNKHGASLANDGVGIQISTLRSGSNPGETSGSLATVICSNNMVKNCEGVGMLVRHSASNVTVTNNVIHNTGLQSFQNVTRAGGTQAKDPVGGRLIVTGNRFSADNLAAFPIFTNVDGSPVLVRNDICFWNESSADGGVTYVIFANNVIDYSQVDGATLDLATVDVRVGNSNTVMANNMFLSDGSTNGKAINLACLNIAGRKPELLASDQTFYGYTTAVDGTANVGGPAVLSNHRTNGANLINAALDGEIVSGSYANKDTINASIPGDYSTDPSKGTWVAGDRIQYSDLTRLYDGSSWSTV